MQERNYPKVWLIAPVKAQHGRIHVVRTVSDPNVVSMCPHRQHAALPVPTPGGTTGFSFLVCASTPKRSYQCNQYCFLHFLAAENGRIEIPLLGNSIWRQSLTEQQVPSTYRLYFVIVVYLLYSFIFHETKVRVNFIFGQLEGKFYQPSLAKDPCSNAKIPYFYIDTFVLMLTNKLSENSEIKFQSFINLIFCDFG